MSLVYYYNIEQVAIGLNGRMICKDYAKCFDVQPICIVEVIIKEI